MASVGIVCEYNPFHNGHLYHLNSIRKLYPNDTIVLVLSGNFTQRGDFSIIDKWTKVKIAKEMGIDLIVELPFVFATQSADFFAYGAISLLEALKVSKIVFGSENDNLDDLEAIAKCQVQNEDFDKLVKIYSKFGLNYPTAVSNALYDLTGKRIDTPNDLLGISYIKTILKNNYKIKPICIKRTTDYHDDVLNNISSATAIRKALENGLDVRKAVPEMVIKYLDYDNLHFKGKYFSLLKYRILTDEDLSSYQGVDEGIDKKLKKAVVCSTSYDELIDSVKSKRYTYNRINRMLLHILVGFTKEMSKSMKKIDYIRILGFNDKGRSYLNKVKKEVNLPILSRFKRNFSPILDFELKTTSIYGLINNDRNLILEEYNNHLGGENNEK